MNHVKRVADVLSKMDVIRSRETRNTKLQALHNQLTDGLDQWNYSAVSFLQRRRVAIMRAWYFNRRRLLPETIAGRHNISQSTVYRDIRMGVTELAKRIEPVSFAKLTEECEEWLR